MEQQKTLIWWIIGIIIALIVAAFAVYYYRFSKEINSPEPSVATPASDSVASINAGLNSMDLNGLDKELTDIEGELAK